MPRKTTQPTSLPPDNPTVLRHMLEEDLPQLSLRDMEAFAPVFTERWKALDQVQRHATMDDHYAHLRALPAGTPLQVVVPYPPGFATRDIVRIERPLRPPSTNIRVHDANGKPWHFPMEWLMSATEDESIRTFLRREAEARSIEGLRLALGG